MPGFRQLLFLPILLSLCSSAVAEPDNSAPIEISTVGVIDPETLLAVRDLVAQLRHKIASDLLLTSLPTSSIRLYADITDYKQVQSQLSGEVIADAYGFIDGETIHVLVQGDDTPKRVVHEWVHIATRRVNPSIANRPRWLWEAIALYEAGQYTPAQQLSCISLSDAPSLSRLNAPSPGSNLIYKTGFLIGDFLFNELGAAATRSLIESNGNVESALRISTDAFESRWHGYVIEHYLRKTGIPPILSEVQIRREVVGNTFYLVDGRHLYFDTDRSIHLKMGTVAQLGAWQIKDATRMCWQIMNFNEFCTNFRMNENRFWLDTPSDCSRYPLRRQEGNAEHY